MQGLSEQEYKELSIPFGWKLAQNLDDQSARVAGNKASMIIIDGAMGEGKTTLAIECAEYIQGYPVVFSEQLAMGHEDFAEKIRLCYQKKHPVVIYDEAGDYNTRGALSKINRFLNRVFETYRAYKIIVIMVTPSFSVLDNSLFDKQIPRLLLHCYGRSKGFGRYVGYDTECMAWIRYNMKQMVLKDAAYKKSNPNFYGNFHNLSPERAQELDKYSTKGKLSILESGKRNLDGLLSYKDIGEKFDRSAKWVKVKVKDLKIKPARSVGNTKYFSSDALEIIREATE